MSAAFSHLESLGALHPEEKKIRGSIGEWIGVIASKLFYGFSHIDSQYPGHTKSQSLPYYQMKRKITPLSVSLFLCGSNHISVPKVSEVSLMTVHMTAARTTRTRIHESYISKHYNLKGVND